jgi:hypothetical protein
MRLMALVMLVLGLMASGSAKAAEARVCGMVVEMSANQVAVVVVVKTSNGTRELIALDNQAAGTASMPKLSSNTNIVNIATAAMNNPGSLNFCAKVNDKKQIVQAGVVNKFVK